MYAHMHREVQPVPEGWSCHFRSSHRRPYVCVRRSTHSDPLCVPWFWLMARWCLRGRFWVMRGWGGVGGGGVVAGKCGGREGRRRPSEVAQRSLVATSPCGKKAVHCRLRTCWWMEESEIMWERETRPRGQRVRGQNMVGFGGGHWESERCK